MVGSIEELGLKSQPKDFRSFLSHQMQFGSQRFIWFFSVRVDLKLFLTCAASGSGDAHSSGTRHIMSLAE